MRRDRHRILKRTAVPQVCGDAGRAVYRAADFEAGERVPQVLTLREEIITP